MKIEAVKVQRLYLQVAEQLSANIRNGSIKVGSKLPSERDLATSFGVSRPTIREAIIALEVAGLVEARSGSGVYVLEAPTNAQPLNPQDDPGPIEILEARLYIESEAAALAAQRASVSDIALMQASLSALTNATGDKREHGDRDFHIAIARAAHNSAIESTITWLWDLRDVSTVSQFFHEKLRSAGVEPVISDHHAIFSAISDKNPEQAKKAMQDHLNRVMNAVLTSSSPSPSPSPSIVLE